MVFSSSIFLFLFFPTFFATYYLIPNRWKNAVIILFSVFFYAWGTREFVVIVIGTLGIDYALGRIINKRRQYARLLVAIDVIMNVAILLYFKYFNFFMDNVNTAMETAGLNPFVFTQVLLPIGVSFVIFQKMTYCLDISMGIAKPAENFFYLLEYLLIFPQIIAGPIVKYNELAEQIKCPKLSWEMFSCGVNRFGWGLFKKVWIADVLARYADTVFTVIASSGGGPIDYAWIGMIAYTFQIYFDFSAYSDMAIGMLSMMGFHIGNNFNMPYISTSVTEFWKRWHISMTSWFREYIYFPLGGNRKGKVRTYINQWVVFLVSGFWHGAAWNFVFWGVYHGTILCVEKAFLLKIYTKIPRLIKWAFTMLLVMIGWVFFRAESIQAGAVFIRTLFNLSSYYTHVNPANILIIDPRGWFTFVLAALICFVPLFCAKTYKHVRDYIANKPGVIAICVLCLFFLAALKVITGAISPFIYFRF